MNRRVVLGALVATGLFAAVKPKRAQKKSPRLRPPGALSEERFASTCIGCFRCAEVCPTSCIRFERDDWLSQALPYVEPRSRACVLCMKCTQACPTGALTPIEPTREVVAATVRMGEPVLTRSKCLPWADLGVCRLCYMVCPYPDKAIVLVGPQKAPMFNREACVGCGLCEEACPDLAHAIVISPPAAT